MDSKEGSQFIFNKAFFIPLEDKWKMNYVDVWIFHDYVTTNEMYFARNFV